MKSPAPECKESSFVQHKHPSEGLMPNCREDAKDGVNRRRLPRAARARDARPDDAFVVAHGCAAESPYREKL